WLEQALRVADTLPAAAPDTDSTAGHFAATGEWPLSPAAVARVLQGAGALAWLESDLPIAREHLERAVGIASAIGDGALLGRALAWLGPVLRGQGERAAGVACTEESVAQARAVGDSWQVAMSLLDLALPGALDGDAASADTLASESLALFRERGDTWGIGIALGLLGISASRQGDHTRARDHLEQGLAIASEFGDQISIARLRMSVGFLTVWQ